MLRRRRKTSKQTGGFGMKAKVYSFGESLYHVECLTPDEIEDAKEVAVEDLEKEESCGNCNELLVVEGDEEEEDET